MPLAATHHMGSSNTGRRGRRRRPRPAGRRAAGPATGSHPLLRTRASPISMYRKRPCATGGRGPRRLLTAVSRRFRVASWSRALRFKGEELSPRTGAPCHVRDCHRMLRRNETSWLSGRRCWPITGAATMRSALRPMATNRVVLLGYLLGSSAVRRQPNQDHYGDCVRETSCGCSTSCERPIWCSFRAAPPC